MVHSIIEHSTYQILVKCNAKLATTNSQTASATFYLRHTDYSFQDIAGRKFLLDQRVNKIFFFSTR
jgi:hypothetical protein